MVPEKTWFHLESQKIFLESENVDKIIEDEEDEEEEDHKNDE